MTWTPTMRCQRWDLPIWTPGSYTVRDHAQYLHSLNLQQTNQSIAFKRVSASSWQIDLDSLERLTLSYCIEARQLTVRTCYLDPDFASLCLAAAVMEVDGYRWMPHWLTFSLPVDWNVHLPLEGSDRYWAEDFDHLVDAPVHAGRFASQEFAVNKNTHQLVCIGEPPGGWPVNLLADISSVCRATCSLMNESPPAANRYQLVIQMLEKGYGGLEHDFGAVLQYSWNSIGDDEGYRKFLQLVGHEYLHQWNVRRLRPREYWPYDYSQAVISEGLWFAEGITSYYDLTLPLLAGLSDRKSLLKDLSDELYPLFSNQGRQFQSLSDSAREAWVKLYKATPSSADTQVSYYRLGAAVAFCLDVRLRLVNSSLANVLRQLWRKFGITRRGYSRHDIQAEIAKISHDLAEELALWLDTPGLLPIDAVINEIGLVLERSNEVQSDLGLTVVVNNSLVEITRVENGSAAREAGLVVGDELIAAQGFRLRKPIDLQKLIPNDRLVVVTYCRRGEIAEANLYCHSSKKKKWQLIWDPNASYEAKLLRDQWFEFI